MLNKILVSLYSKISSQAQTKTRVGFSQDSNELVLTDSRYLIILDNVEKDAT